MTGDKEIIEKLDKTTGWKHNPNGNMTEEQMIELLKLSEKELYDYIATMKILNHPCPPKKLIALPCFYCYQCFNNAFDAIKAKRKKGKL